MIILVPTCKAYSDAWVPFQALRKKFWPDCKYPVYIVTDELPQSGLPVGSYVVMDKDYGWCWNLRQSIIKYEREEFVLVLQEDFFFNAAVDNRLVDSALEVLKQDPRAAMVRLMPCPGPNRPFNDDFGIIDYETPYRVSCQATIWRKEPLIRILNQMPTNGTAAHFEIEGSKVKLANWNFYAAYVKHRDRFSYFVSAISRGQWNPQAVQFCKDNDIPIDTSRRPIEGRPS